MPFLVLNYDHFLAMASLDCKVYCTVLPKGNMHVVSIAIEYCSQGVCVPHLVMPIFWFTAMQPTLTVYPFLFDSNLVILIC